MNTPKSILFLFFGCCLWANSASGTTYYVSVDGSDSNTGMSETDAWRYCPGVPGWSGSATLQPGDFVYFRNSDTWNAPGGSNAVLQVTGGVTYDGSSWGDGTRAILRPLGELNRSVVNFMDDHPTEPTIVTGFDLDSNSQIASGAAMNWPQMDKDLTGATKRVENCIVHDVAATHTGNGYEYGILIGGWLGRHIHNVEILNNKVYNIARSGICDYLGNDIPGNQSKNVVISGNEIYNTGVDTSSNVGTGIALKNHAVDTIVEYNYIHDVRIGMNITTHPEADFIGPQNAIIRHNILRNCGQGPITNYDSTNPRCGMYITNNGNKSMAIYGNLFVNIRRHAIILKQELSDDLSVKIYNNTFYKNCDSDWGSEIRLENNHANITALEVVNNIFYLADPTRAIVDSGPYITRVEKNVYYSSIPGKTLVVSGAGNFTAANISAYDPSAITEDPLLFDVSMLPTGFIGTFDIDMKPNTKGLNLTQNSPAKDHAIDLGPSFDSSINSLTRPQAASWDVGAYEFGDGTYTVAPQAPGNLWIKR